MKYTHPHWNASALIMIDMQNDFSLAGAPAEIMGTMDVVPNLKRLLATYRKAKLPIIHVVRLYQENGSNVDLCRKEMIESGVRIVTPDTAGSQIVQELLPTGEITLSADLLLKGHMQKIGDNEWVLYKPRWGAFYQTVLEPFLRSMGVDTLVFGGCNFPNCPRTSIYEASERDFRTVLAVDATSGIYDKGIAELKNIQVLTSKTSEILNQIQSLGKTE